MGKLFDLDGPSQPSPEVDRPKEIQRMGGHGGSLESATAAAPDSTAVATPTSTSSSKRGRKATAQTQTIQPMEAVKTAADLEREKRQMEALSKMSGLMMKDMAGAPYEAWAFVSGDDRMLLSEEEEKIMGEAYQLVAEGLNMGRMNPLLTCSLFLLASNGKLVRKRIRFLREDKLNEEVREIEDSKSVN